MEIQGVVHEIYDTVQITDTFRKREIIIEYAENPAYPEYLKMEAIQANCSAFDSLQKGDPINISFNIKGRAWNDPKTGRVNYFNTLQIWKINPVNTTLQNNGARGQAPVMQSTNNIAQSGSANTHNQSNTNFEDDSDLPF
ncbi:MAG: DUF3127 domain-containing protein [Solitalea-like symbiont of Tyrophagus putrescentiae]